MIFNFYLLIYYIQARALIRKPKLLLLRRGDLSAQFNSSYSLRRSSSSPSTRPPRGRAAQPSLLPASTFPSHPYIYIHMNVFIFIWKILTVVQLPEGLCPLYESRRIALTHQSPRTSPRQRNKPLPITIISHIQPFLPSPREMYRITIFSDTRNHASSSINLAVPPPHVHASPTTAPRVSLSRSLAHPLHTKQHASDQGKRACNECKPSPSSSCKFTSPLLLSLCVTSPSRPPRYLVTRVLSSLLFFLLMYIQA